MIIALYSMYAAFFVIFLKNNRSKIKKQKKKWGTGVYNIKQLQ
jgi:hypothetical protein